MSVPAYILHPWASALSAPYISTIPDPPTGSARASWQDGFPPLTFTDPGSGGSLPWGADFNGALNALSANVQWIQAGARWGFDATFATDFGGYPVGAVIPLTDGVSFVISTANANTGNPNSSMTGWAPYGGTLTVTGDYAVDTGAVNAVALAVAPAPTSYATGKTVRFKAGNTSTGAVTVNLNGLGAKSLKRLDGSATVSGDIVAGSVYSAVYDGTNFVLLAPTQLQVAPPRASGSFTQGASAVTIVATGPDAMAGLGFQFTPASSGTVLVVVAASATNNSGGASAVAYGARYGTGTPPTLGSALAGTQVSTRVTGTLGSGADSNHSFTTVLTGLTPGTTYWLDMAASSAGANLSIHNTDFSIAEL